jgi:hypothetical protein
MVQPDTKRPKGAQHFHGSYATAEYFPLKSRAERKSGRGRSHFDTLDKVLGIFAQPPNGTSRSRTIYRRVDLIFAPINRYWTAGELYLAIDTESRLTCVS